MSRLSEIAENIGQQSNPPVHLWKPMNLGVIDIRINTDGSWFHEGDPINRMPLVKLFASILWYEDNSHFLVTPVEKLKITVEDVPLIVQQMEQLEDAWVAITNVHDQVIIDEQHPVELRLYQQQWIPYIRIRYDLWARVNRRIYYQWVSAALETQTGDDGLLMLNSQSYKFAVGCVN